MTQAQAVGVEGTQHAYRQARAGAGPRLQQHYEMGRRWVTLDADGDVAGELHDIALSYKGGDGGPEGDGEPRYHLHVRGLLRGEVVYCRETAEWEVVYDDGGYEAAADVEAIGLKIRQQLRIWPHD